MGLRLLQRSRNNGKETATQIDEQARGVLRTDHPSSNLQPNFRVLLGKHYFLVLFLYYYLWPFRSKLPGCPEMLSGWDDFFVN